MKIIAHRGLSEKYPENTLLAFRKALEVNADGIETDLRLSLDGKIILFHDDTLNRITGVDKAPESLSFLELKKIDVGRGEKIPSLDELLHLINAQLTLILEIKYNLDIYKKICEITAKKIEDKLEWVEVSCFEDKVLEYMHHLNPRIKLHKLIEESRVLTVENFESRYTYISYLDVNILLRNILLEQGFIQRYKVILWVQDNEDISKEIDAGLYGIMRNDIE